MDVLTMEDERRWRLVLMYMFAESDPEIWGTKEGEKCIYVYFYIYNNDQSAIISTNKKNFYFPY